MPQSAHGAIPNDLAASVPALCEDKTGAENPEVLSLLEHKCGSCHGPGSSASGSIDFITDLDKVIDRGLVFPGNSRDSRLFQVITAGTMPPGRKMAEAEISLLANWIDKQLASNASAKGQILVDAKRCPPLPEIDRKETPTYLSDMQRIVGTYCVGCHAGTQPFVGKYEELKGSAGGQGLSMAEAGKMPIPGHGFPAVPAADLKIFQDFRSGITPHNSSVCPSIQDHLPAPKCELKVFGATTLAAGSEVTISAHVEGVASTIRWEDMDGEAKFLSRDFARTVKLDRSKEFKLFVKSPSGEASCSVKLEMLPQAPSCRLGVVNSDGSLNTSPQTAFGSSLTLELYLSGSVTSAKNEDQSSIDVNQPMLRRTISNLTASRTYSATVSGPGFSDFTCPVSVTVGAAAPLPTCQLTWTRGSGNIYTIGLASVPGGTDATTLFLRNKSIGGIFQGYTSPLVQTIAAVTEYEAYGKDALGRQGPNCTMIVTPDQVLTPPPTCTVTASKTSIFTGDSINLSYSLTSGSATAVKIFDGTNFIDAPAAPGNKSLTPTASTNYKVQLTYSGGTVFCGQPVTVAVQPPPTPPNCILSANSYQVLPGASMKLTMNTTGTATSAAINGVACSTTSMCRSISNDQYEYSFAAPTAEGNYSYSGIVSGAGSSKTCALNTTVRVSLQPTNSGLKKLAKFGSLIKASYCSFCHLEVKGDLYLPTDHTFGGIKDRDVDYRTKAWVTGKVYNMASRWRTDYTNGGIIHVPASNIVNNFTGSGGLPIPASGKVPLLPWVDPQMRAAMTGTLSGSGLSSMINKSHTGTVVITSPITINKDVFIDGDVIIKGEYSGVGTIYATGHVYIPGNLTAKTSGDFLGIASQKSINLGYLYKTWMKREDKEEFHKNTDLTGCVGPLTNDGMACLPANMPGGQAAFEALYDTYDPVTNKCPSDPNNGVRMNAAKNPKRASFTRIEAFLYTPNSVNGVADAQAYTIKGGVVTQHYHVLSCARDLKVDRESAVGSSVLEYDPRMGLGTLPVLEFLGGQYND